MSCARKLNQWEVLAEFGHATENFDILLDSLWRLPQPPMTATAAPPPGANWAELRDVVLPKAQVEETSRLRMVQAYCLLQENDAASVKEAESRVSQVDS